MRDAWEAYRATDDYTNTRRWALHEGHVDGSLWAAFIAGYAATSPAPRPDWQAVAYDRELIARMLEMEPGVYSSEAISEQIRLLRAADGRDADGVHTANIAELADSANADLLRAGAMLANCAFNLAQRSHLTDDERRSLDEARKYWDAARTRETAQGEGKGHG